jgi:hypothetical protein
VQVAEKLGFEDHTFVLQPASSLRHPGKAGKVDRLRLWADKAGCADFEDLKAEHIGWLSAQDCDQVNSETHMRIQDRMKIAIHSQVVSQGTGVVNVHDWDYGDVLIILLQSFSCQPKETPA